MPDCRLAELVLLSFFIYLSCSRDDQFVNAIRYSRKPFNQIKPHSRTALKVDFILGTTSKYVASVAGTYSLLRFQAWNPVFYSFAFATCGIIFATLKQVHKHIFPSEARSHEHGLFMPDTGYASFLSYILIAQTLKSYLNPSSRIYIKTLATSSVLYTVLSSALRIYARRLSVLEAFVGMIFGGGLGFLAITSELRVVSSLSLASPIVLKVTRFSLFIACLIAFNWKKMLLFARLFLSSRSRYLVTAEASSADLSQPTTVT